MIHASKLLKRLQKAIAAFPVSSMLSFSAGMMNLEDDSRGFQQPLQGRDAEGFATPVLPASAQKLFDEQKEQMDKLLQQMERQREENKEKEERQREEMEQQRKENKEKEEKAKGEGGKAKVGNETADGTAKRGEQGEGGKAKGGDGTADGLAKEGKG